MAMRECMVPGEAREKFQAFASKSGRGKNWLKQWPNLRSLTIPPTNILTWQLTHTPSPGPTDANSLLGVSSNGLGQTPPLDEQQET